MLKQLPSRNQRSKGFKVKHFLQICVLTALFFWLFNQLKHSYDIKKPSENPQILEEIAKLGRKHLYPRIDETSTDKIELEEEIKPEDTEPERVEDEESEEVEDLIDVDDDIKPEFQIAGEHKLKAMDQIMVEKA